MMKRVQMNIEIEEDLLKSLKLIALRKNVKLSEYVKDILSEKINCNIKNEISEAQLNEYKNELSQLSKRVSNIEKAQRL